jgi:capsular polysaccharide biosynthesis protein
MSVLTRLRNEHPVLWAQMKGLRNSAFRRVQTVLRRMQGVARFDSQFLGGPRKIVRGVQPYVSRLSREGEVGAEYRELYARRDVRLDPPNTLGEIHPLLRENMKYEEPADFVAILPQGRVWGDGGAVLGPDDSLLMDVSEEFRLQDDRDHSIFHRLRLPKMKRLEGTVAVLSVPGSTNFFHWMLQVVPRVHLLEKAGLLHEVDHFLVSDLDRPYQRQSLEAVGLPMDRVLTAKDEPHIRARRLLVPSVPTVRGRPPRWMCDYLRERFLDAPASERAGERIYVSRRTASFRRVLNEDEVVAELERRGFRVLVMDGLSVKEQAAAFHGAEAIVAPHGAALTSLAFCREGSQLLELFAPTYIQGCYFRLAKVLDMDYWYAVGRGEGDGTASGVPHVQADIDLDLDVLGQTLDAMGLT